MTHICCNVSSQGSEPNAEGYLAQLVIGRLLAWYIAILLAGRPMPIINERFDISSTHQQD